MAKQDPLNPSIVPGGTESSDPPPIEGITRDPGQHRIQGGQAPPGQGPSESRSSAAKTAGQAAQNQARAIAERQKSRAVERLGGMAHALRQTGQQLHQQNQHTTAEYAEKAAGRVERFLGDISAKDIDDVVRDAERSVRRQPALVLGGAVAIGFMISRFLKSSTRRGVEGRPFVSGGGEPGEKAA